MARQEGIDGATEASDLAFQPAEIDEEVSPGENKNFKVDPTLSEVASPLEIEVNLAFCGASKNKLHT